MTAKMIPMLPCRSITENVDFYRALGFEVTYQQKQPNNYAVLEFEDVQLHFFGLKAQEPQDNYSTCYVLTDEVDRIYDLFTSGLRAALGKLPARGYPRINPIKNLRSGARQFVVVDPSGNYVRIGQPIAEANNGLATGPAGDEPKLVRALESAIMFADSKDDPAAAVRVLDRALKLDEPVSGPLRFRALMLRADLAVRLDDEEAARGYLSEVDGLDLTTEEFGQIQDELRRRQDLREQLAMGATAH